MSTFNITTAQSSILNNPNWDTKNDRSDIQVQRIKHPNYKRNSQVLCDQGLCVFVKNDGFSISNNGYINISNSKISKNNIENNDNYAKLIRSQLLSKQMKQGHFDFYRGTTNKLFPGYSITRFVFNQNINHTIFINNNSFRSQSQEFADTLSQYDPLSQNTHQQYTFIASDYYLGEDVETYENKLSILGNDIINQYGGKILDVSPILKAISIEFTRGNTQTILSEILSDFRISDSMQNSLVTSDTRYHYHGFVIPNSEHGDPQLRKYMGQSGYIHTRNTPILKSTLPYGGSYKDINTWPVAMNPYWMEDDAAIIDGIDYRPCVKIKKKTPQEFISAELDGNGCWASPNFSNKYLEQFLNGVENITDINLSEYLSTYPSPIVYCAGQRRRQCALWSREQSGVPWHLARLNGYAFKKGGDLATMRHYAGRTKPRNTMCGTLKPPVYVYILDQPVGSFGSSHPEFEGRLTTLKGPRTYYRNGGNHGQNVASCIGGRQMGVTRKPQLVSIGVLSSGSGWGDHVTIAEGILDTIKDKISNPNKKILINMSLGGYSGPLLYLSQIVNITINNSGSGYIEAPTVIIDTPTGYRPEQARAKAIISGEPNGQVTNIIITNRGSGFISAPTITIVGGKGTDAMAYVSKMGTEGDIEKISIKNIGSNYISTPTISIIDNSGSGAVLSPVIENGKISSITIVEKGKGYKNPKIVITGGKGETATATAEIDLVPQFNIMEIAIQKAIKDYNIPVVVAAGNSNLPANLFSPARLGSHRPDWSADSPYISVVGATTVGPDWGIFMDKWKTLAACSYITISRFWGSGWISGYEIQDKGWWGNYWDQKARFSNYGDAITAWGPGQDISVATTKYISIGNTIYSVHGYTKQNGTSFAAPLAAGILAENIRVQQPDMSIGGHFAKISPSFISCASDDCVENETNLSEGQVYFAPISGIVGLKNRIKKTVEDIPDGGGFIGFPNFYYAGPDRDAMIRNPINPGTTQYTINDLDDETDCISYNPNISVNFMTQPMVYGNKLIVNAHITT